MELYKYILCIKSGKNVWLVNLVNGVIISITEYDYEKLLNGECYKIKKENLDILKKRGFIVKPTDNNFDINAINKVAINLNLTNECNFDCDYCYFKANNKEKVIISIDEKELLAWFEKFIIPKKCDIYVNYLGGEPLIEIKKLLAISISMKNLAIKNHIQYHGEITTNGFYLSSDIAKLLLDAGIKMVQVTIDGEREEHNRTRRCKSGMYTYDIIIKNICKCKDIIPIMVRINIHKKMNISTIEKLLEDLKKNDIKNIYFSCIEKNYTDDDNHEKANDYTFNDDEALEKYIEVWSMQKRYGFNFVQEVPSIISNCIAKNPNGYTINYNGKMFSCPSSCGIEEFFIDDLYAFKGNRKEEKSVLPQCKKCSLFPLCMGGCEVTNKFQGTEKKCRKQYIEKLIKHYYILKYSI